MKRMRVLTRDLLMASTVSGSDCAETGLATELREKAAEISAMKLRIVLLRVVRFVMRPLAMHRCAL